MTSYSRLLYGPSTLKHLVSWLVSSLNQFPPSHAGGLSGIGLGLGPGGQPIDATQLNRGGMGNVGPGGNSMSHVDLFGMFALIHTH